MISKEDWVSYKTIAKKEIKRFFRIWPQTLFPPVITVSLYFLIFGNLIGPRIGLMGGVNYMEFIVPGLAMLTVITTAYNNVVSSFYSSKFQSSIEELLISPTPNYIIILGYVTGGVVRGLLVGVVVIAVSHLFQPIHIWHPLLLFLVAFLSALLFALAGFLNAIYAKKFDDITVIPTFILTPLTYLGGIFYSISIIPDVWQMVSRANPILYIIQVFRYAMLGFSEVSVMVSMSTIILFNMVLFLINLRCVQRGVGLRT